MIYDLSFHLYPRRDSDWRFHCRKLTENLHIFTGRRVIGIAYDDQTEHPQTVENEMYGCFETITVRNKPEYRETSTLIPRLWLLEDADPNRATFFGHSKCASHQDPKCVYWRDEMYRGCFDFARVDEALATHPACGTYKLVNVQDKGDLKWAWPPWTHWHFAGAFYWIRNRDLYANRRWQIPPIGTHTGELLPGWLFPPDDGHCLAHNNETP